MGYGTWWGSLFVPHPASLAERGVLGGEKDVFILKLGSN